jgi:two-component system, cell cycle sensor histidine kinase and response regulator CckA
MPATVLVVDDESPVVEIIQDILERRGYRVLATSDSEQALAMLDEDPGPIHLLLTDVMMRSHSGFEVAERAQRRWPEVQVIFMSGHTRETLPEDTLPPNARVLVKPISLEALLAAVRTALGPEAIAD